MVIFACPSIFFCIFASEMIHLENYYWYGLAAMAYLITCWVFVAVRWFHTCQAPKEHHAYIWPDRKLMVCFYLCATVLLPYVLNPTSEAAWLLEKTYFPCTYYYYCGALLFCFFGSVKQRNRWKTTNLIAATVTLTAMLPLIIHAWLPDELLPKDILVPWPAVIVIVSIVMMGYAAMAIWQVWCWMKEACEENYSNPDDFPMEYARRVWLAPVLLTPMLWPAYLLDSQPVMAVMNLLLAASNIVLLLTVLPVWRRQIIFSDSIDSQQETAAYDELAEEPHVELAEERTNRIAAEIEHYVKTQKAFLDAHLKLEHVVAHCSYSRSYVSKVFQNRFGGFSDYVNGLRLDYYRQYMQQHPNTTMEAGAQASGFTTYRAYHRAKRRYEKVTSSTPDRPATRRER